MSKVKIAILSDWHGDFNLHVIPQSDIICVCGDMLKNNDVHKYEKWLMNLPCELVLVIPGNHDIPLKKENWQPKEQNKVFNPIRQPVTYKGITFGGFCWSYADSIEMAYIWSFMTLETSALRRRLAKVPACDILLSHAPPSCREMLIDDCRDIGVPGMIEWAIDNNCKHIFCGHIHERAGKVLEIAGVNIVNAALSLMTITLDTDTIGKGWDYPTLY